MVSLISDLTDSKGPRARRGWIFFDADCAFCIASARWLRRVFEPRGFGFAALQDPRSQEHLHLPLPELLHEMRVLSSDGRQFGGADSFIFLARRVWWMWPLVAVSVLPGMRSFFRHVYLWVAAHRSCRAGSCAVPPAFRVSQEESLEGGNRK